MPGFKPAEGAPLANAAKRHRIALRDKAKAERELEHQRRLEQIAEETAKAEIAKARKPREQAPNAERAWPQERPAPKPSPVLAPVVSYPPPPGSLPGGASTSTPRLVSVSPPGHATTIPPPLSVAPSVSTTRAMALGVVLRVAHSVGVLALELMLRNTM
jgi:hypothetical protein